VVTTPARLPLTGVPVAAVGRHSAAFAAWATAYVRGEVPLQQAVAQIAHHDEPHVVDAPDLALASPALADLLTDLRARRIDGVRLVLPVPGDPRGLPGPGPFSDAALAAGEAVRVQGGDLLAGPGDGAYGLVPVIVGHGNDVDGRAITVRWRVYSCEPAVADPPGTRRQAEHDLTDALREAASSLVALDVARLDPEQVEALHALRTAGPALTLPPGHPGVGLWIQAERIAAIVDLAATDDGGAYDRVGASARRTVLRELAAAVRRAKTSAINAPLDLPATAPAESPG
jgi:hypothetical protein